MMIIWGLAIGLPLLAFGGVVLFSLDNARRFTQWFVNSKALAAVLTVAAWFLTARECNMLGIAVFDRFLKVFPGQLWIMAAVHCSEPPIITVPRRGLCSRRLMFLFIPHILPPLSECMECFIRGVQKSFLLYCCQNSGLPKFSARFYRHLARASS